ncbi:MAG: hypothetical protein V4443_09815 [Pseudomonadota bacterium]
MKNSFALSAIVFVAIYALVFFAIYLTDTMLLPGHALVDASLIALVFGVAGSLTIAGSQT